MIIAAADGSSLSNPGPAGWAWYIDDEHWAAGGWPSGTNNMGELQAVLDLLHSTATQADEPIRILCDSQYVINALTRWLPGWKRRGWKKADGKAVLNQDLLKAIDQAMVGRDISFEWVKGHSGHPMNEAADRRARAAATAYRDGLSVERGPGFVPGGNQATTPTPSVPAEQATAPTDDAPADLFTWDGADATVLGVVEQEKALLSDAVRSDKSRFRDHLHPDFCEFGSTGKVRNRSRSVVEVRPLEIRVRYEPIGVDRLSADLILLRWRAVAPTARWLRSSLWQRVDGVWLLRFTQATRISG